MKNDDVPTRLLNNEQKRVGGAGCVSCGGVVEHGHIAKDGGLYCLKCYITEKGTYSKDNNPVRCPCGDKTSYKKTHPRGDVEYFCPGCLSTFTPDTAGGDQ